MSPWCRTTVSWPCNSNKLLRDTLAITPTTMPTLMVMAMLTPPPAAMAIVKLLPVLRVGPDRGAGGVGGVGGGSGLRWWALVAACGGRI